MGHHSIFSCSILVTIGSIALGQLALAMPSLPGEADERLTAVIFSETSHFFSASRRRGAVLLAISRIQIGALQIGAVHHRVTQFCASQIGALQIGVVHLRVAQIRIAEISACQVSTD